MVISLEPPGCLERVAAHWVCRAIVVSLGMACICDDQVAMYTLDAVHPITHAVGNTIKRVILILFSVVFFGSKMTQQRLDQCTQHVSTPTVDMLDALTCLIACVVPLAPRLRSWESSCTRWPRPSSRASPKQHKCGVLTKNEQIFTPLIT